jgi:hypothetical protein
MPQFVIKDSGQRQEYGSGMVRDLQEGKPRFDLMWPEDVPFEDQFMTRIAAHLTKGIAKYGERNWEKANSPEELERFRSSALRHMHQYLCGDTDEDHASAVVFNLIAAVTTEYKLDRALAAIADERLDG